MWLDVISHENIRIIFIFGVTNKMQGAALKAEDREATLDQRWSVFIV